MRKPLQRRQFLQTSAAASVLGFWSGVAPAADKKVSANEQLNVGFIGTQNQAKHDMTNIVAAGVNVAALCDVDEAWSAEVRQKYPNANFYVDFRKLLDHKGLDAVMVATPDHTHAPATVRALRAGLHVFCEKPLTHTVAEARLVAETAKKQKRVTQMGTQIHAGSNYRRAVELVQSDAIGKVKEVHVWCGTSWGGGDRPKEMPRVPTGLHYDLWLGPAPERPYHSTYLPFYWRRWWDFGGGTLADMGCHYIDLAFWALKLRHPTRVETEGPPVHPETAPVWQIARYEFPARGELPPVKLTWYDGGKRPALLDKLPEWKGNGVLFIGDKGMLIADYGRHKLLPEKDFAGFTPPKPFIADSIGHYKEWVEACKSNGPTTCNFDYAGALAEAVLLGTVAYRLGRPISWDAKHLKATGDADADRYLHKEYRKGWEV